MSHYPVTRTATDAVLTRLSMDDPDGFNGVYNVLASDYGVASDMGIIWTPDGGAASPNFARANVSPADWTHASAFKFPFVTLFGEYSVNNNAQKFHQFAGWVTVGFNVFLSWRAGRVLIDFEGTSACVEETVYTVLNRARNADPGDQDWGETLAYNGDLSMTPSRLERGEEFWQQLLAFKMKFEVLQRGAV